MGDGTQSLDLASYIANLSVDVKAEVFSSTWTAQALFRGLSPLAKQYILRLVYTDGGLPKDTMQLWLQLDKDGIVLGHHQQTIQRLEQLSVLQTDQRGFVQLNADFRRCLIATLSGRGQGVPEVGQQQYSGPPPQKLMMDHAARQWKAVLLYILDSESHFDLPITSDGSGFSIQDLLLSAGLVEVKGRRHELTSAGLRYLLQPTNAQVWLLLRQYIKVAEQTSGSELASTLSFLMQLSFRRVWQPYPLAALTPREQDIAAHMAQLGLVATCKQDGATFFCATPLAASLCGGTAVAAAAGGGGADGSGPGSKDGAAGSALHTNAYIIVETNFRVYAHTSSRLQRDVLSRLMRTDCLLPNLYVGTLTRDTFMTALEAGLTAADVTHFLQSHAHPQVARRVPTVPENVQDQLVLWEEESKRVVAEPAISYSSWEDEDLWNASVATAENQGTAICVWGFDKPLKDRALVIRRSGHEALKNFIVEYKKQRQQRQQQYG